MKTFLAICLVVGSLATVGQTAHAEIYRVSITRKGSNLYKVDGRSIYVLTRYCYVYAYSEDSILKVEGRGGSLIFVESPEQCDVKGAFGEAKIDPGTYKVTLSQEADDWYEVFGTDTFIKTSLCLNLALASDAVLTIQAGGFGRLAFDRFSDCAVEGVYTRLRL